jgi:hypothetical protein
LKKGIKIELRGQMEIQSGDEPSTWLFGLPLGYRNTCWVNARFIKLDGDLSNIEPGYYPDKAPLPPFFHKDFPPPSEVKAVREGDRVKITWTGSALAGGDREDGGKTPIRPIALLEAWTCQGGKIVFTPIGAYELFGSAQVKDEAGCSEISHGQVFTAHKDGYIGPVIVDWPSYPTTTP